MAHNAAAPDGAERATGSQTGNGSATSPAAPAPDARRTLWICASLAAVTLAAFWPVVGNGFVSFDDEAYVTANGRVLAGLNWDNVKWAFSTEYFGNWHPITWLSHMLDVQLFGLNPGFHHLHSVFLHAGSAVHPLSGPPTDDPGRLAQRFRRRPLCPPPAPRRIGRLGRRTKGCAEHVLRPAQPVGLCAATPKSKV